MFTTRCCFSFKPCSQALLLPLISSPLAGFLVGNDSLDSAVADVATEAEIRPLSAMRLFRQVCELNELESRTRHRSCRAEYLLTEGIIKRQDIISGIGFRIQRFDTGFEPD